MTSMMMMMIMLMTMAMAMTVAMQVTVAATVMLMMMMVNMQRELRDLLSDDCKAACSMFIFLYLEHERGEPVLHGERQASVRCHRPGLVGLTDDYWTNDGMLIMVRFLLQS